MGGVRHDAHCCLPISISLALACVRRGGRVLSRRGDDADDGGHKEMQRGDFKYQRRNTWH